MPIQMSPAAGTVRTTRILILGAGGQVVREVRKALQHHPNFQIVCPRDVRAGIGDVRGGRFDVVVVDHDLWRTSESTLRDAAQEAGTIAVVVIGEESEGRTADEVEGSVAVSHLDDAGGTSQLVEAVTAAAESLRAIRRRETMNRWLEREALTDSLTGLHNQRAFTDTLEMACLVSRGRGVGLILVNVVGTGMVNHNYGRQTGDGMLQRTATGIARCIRPADFAARIEDDKFALIIPDADIELCCRVARRIGQEIERLNTTEWADELPINLTFGAACGSDCEGEELLSSAREQLNKQRRIFPAFACKPRGYDDGPSVA